MNDTRKRTNSNQFAKLVELMERNPDLAKGLGAFGSTKRNQKEYWEQFAVELNSLGPPSRDGKDWHKVWLDFKQKLKKKILTNKKEVVATGGGPCSQLSLSPLEQAVDDLLSLQHAVNPTGISFGVESRPPLKTVDVSKNNPEISEDAMMQQVLEDSDENFNQNVSKVGETEQGSSSTSDQRSLPARRRVMENISNKDSERLKLLKDQTDTHEFAGSRQIY